MKSTLAILLLSAWPLAAEAQTLVAPFDTSYSVVNLGSVPGLPLNYGGLVVKIDDPSKLIIGGAANGANGALYTVGLVRDAEGHITGFNGEATYFAAAQYNDGGVAYGPGNVLFLARWPVNELGQLRPGSVATDRVDLLAPFGVESSHSSLNFVPVGFPGAGRMKLCTYIGGQWNDVSIAPDGLGTYSITNVTQVAIPRLQGGPEGFTYPPVNSPQFGAPSMLLSEYAAGKVVAYELDGNGDPLVETRREFISGLTGAEGANIDPVTGDFLFSTFGGFSQVVLVRGFTRPCPADFNGDGNLDPDDLSDYISCFFAQPPCPRADFSNDGITDPDDLADYIGAFFGGCP